jgi:hypothetical protein
LSVYDNYVGITCAIRREYWKELGIETWNDLLIQIFGKINFTNNKYKGFRYVGKSLVISYFSKISIASV